LSLTRNHVRQQRDPFGPAAGIHQQSRGTGRIGPGAVLVDRSRAQRRFGGLEALVAPRIVLQQLSDGGDCDAE
jgi:hypothetical protein